MTVGNYTLGYLGSTFRRGRGYDELRARLAVYRDGKQVGIVAAGKNRSHVESFFSNAVAIRTDWLRAEDLFVIGDRFNTDGSVDLAVIASTVEAPVDDSLYRDLPTLHQITARDDPSTPRPKNVPKTLRQLAIHMRPDPVARQCSRLSASPVRLPPAQTPATGSVEHFVHGSSLDAVRRPA